MTRRALGRVQGTVQGVGFRPYVYRLAREEGLGGYVLNDERGVVLDVEGAADAVERFVARLAAEAPPLAAIESVAWTALPPTGAHEFRILASGGGGEPAAPVTADAATCDDCLAELFDPADRRFRHPFVNCTNCGPRFTIVREVPYDRPLTTMAALHDVRALPRGVRGPGRSPLSRAAQRVPRLRAAPCTWRGGGRPRDARGRGALHDGAILAVKGLGGYHLACRADDEGAVARLRARKHREDRPFALMAPDLDAARTLVALTESEAELLTAPRPPDRPRDAA